MRPILVFLIILLMAFNLIKGAGAQGRIAFVAAIKGNWDLFTIAPDGSGLSQLTHTEEDERSPAWSPNGRRIAYCTNLGALYVINRDGTGRRRLCEGRHGITSPCWSPDGQGIAFVRYEANIGEKSDIHLFDLATSEATVLLSQASAQLWPSWSSDGSTIIYSSLTCGYSCGVIEELWTFDTKTRKAKKAFASPASNIYPDFSPDGKQIAFASDRRENLEVYVARPDGSSPKRLTRHSALDTDPCWSPDAREIAFVSSRSGGLQIHIVSSDGKNVRMLTGKAVSGLENCECKDPDWL